MSKLTRLLRERMRMLREDASAVAQVVEEAFRGASELEDDALDPQLRQVFYDLQDEKVLKVRRQEFERDGQRLRGYFWSIDDQPRFDRWAPGQEPDEYQDLYEGLRDGAWQRRQPPR